MKADQIQHVAVIGAGTMGAGIAGLFARAGCDVRLVDRTEELLRRGLAALGKVPGVSSAVRRRVSGTTVLADACRDAQLVVEAAAEDLGLKQDLFRQIEAAVGASTVLATNTSGLSITAIAAGLRRPRRVAGMHFWNPPHLVPLVEVVQGRETSPATARLLMELARRLGKRPILVRRDIPGFVGNRLQAAVLREALHLLAEGVASAQDIDTAMTAGPGFRYAFMGPLRTADLGGLDVFLAISRYLLPELSARRDPPPLLADLVAQGRLGAKTGAGIYDYPPHELERMLAGRDRVLSKIALIIARESPSSLQANP